MPEDSNELEGRMSRLSDDELVKVVTADSDNSNQMEIVFAEEELRDRDFQLERSGSGLRIIPPDSTKLTTHKTVTARGQISSVIRDVIIVWVLTAAGGFVVGFAAGVLQLKPPLAMLALIASNFLLGTVAFTIVGCLAPLSRWRHLGFVALGAWFTSLINVVFFGVTIPQWVAGAIFMAIIMGIGGSLSYLFKRETKPSA
jgi:hypothetical protein